MITRLISTGVLLVGITMTINGVAVKAEDLLASASSATNQANMYQFRTALDLYYLDHNSYPNVIGGDSLLSTLKDEKYIRENKPLDPESFDYQVKDNGQDYLLEIK